MISCELCGEYFDKITSTHLRWKHSGMTLLEYAQKFPYAPLASEHSRKLTSYMMLLQPPFSEDHCQAISEGLIRAHQEDPGLAGRRRLAPARSPEAVENWRKSMEELWADLAFKEEASQRALKLWQNPEYRARQVEVHRKNWINPEFVREQVESWHRKPNGPEETLMNLLDRVSPGRFCLHISGEQTDLLWGWGYRGLRQPDIVRIDGRRQIIFLDGNYWHWDEDERELVGSFSLLDIDCLVVWADSWEDVILEWPSLFRRLNL